MSPINRRIVLWLFPVALSVSLAQAGGLVHGISHVVSDARVSDGAGKARVAGADLCSLCASFAKVTHAASVGPVDALAIASAAVDLGAPGIAVVARGANAPRSRGPPHLF